MKAMRIRVFILFLCVLGFCSVSSAQILAPILQQQPSSASGNTFTKVAAANFSCSSSPCTVTHTFTSGNAVQIVFGGFAVNSFMTTIGGAGTWTIPASCQVSDSIAGSMSCAYILSNTGGTSISITYSGGSTAQGTFVEYSASPGPISLDGTPAAVDRSTASATQTMITPTLTGSSDAILQGIQIGTSSVSGFTTAYTTAQSGGTFGSVYIFNSNLTTAPVANLGASTQASVCELAFK